MIDWDRVDELRHEVGEEDFEEVADMFFEEVEEVLATLGNTDTLARDLHYLKGSALNLGFTQLATLCREGETDQPKIADIRAEYAAAKAELTSAV